MQAQYNYLMVMTAIKEYIKQRRLNKYNGVLERWEVWKFIIKQYNWMVRRKRKKTKDNLVVYWVSIIMGHPRARGMDIVLSITCFVGKQWKFNKQIK